jgi:primary-amine oxidase
VTVVPASRTRHLVALIGVLGLIAVVGPIGNDSADAGGLTCSGSFLVSETFPSGSKWEMCWENRAIEGIVLRDVTFTPPGGSGIEILDSAYLSQIHVPYDDNGARFHDVSDIGLGNTMETLDGGDCPGGTVDQDVLCRQVTNGGYAYKYGTADEQIETLSLFSSSQMGQYNYVVAWNFDEDGAIRPEVGATGQLQRYGGGVSTGWNVDNPAQFAIAHFHNYYWRLDFDLDGTGDDKVQELAARPSPNRTTWTNTRTGFSTERERPVSPRGQRSWRVRDLVTTNDEGHPISYELLPNSDHVFNGPSFEEFTQNELFATRFRTCERFASHNHSAFGACPGTPTNVHDFVTGESLAADVVVWYGSSFHHLPRNEDENHMDAHWTGFTLQPRDLTDVYPIP